MAAAADESIDAYIMFVGASGVGKSCYTHYLQVNAAATGDDARPEATIGMQFRFFSRTSDKNAPYAPVRFVLVDIGGQDNFRNALPVMYRRAEVVVFMYDLTDRASFDALRTRFWPETREHARNMRFAIVIGNKADRAAASPDARAVTREEGAAFAASIGAYDFFERSALFDTPADIFWPIDKCALHLTEIGPADKYRRPPRIRLHATAGAGAKPAEAPGCCS